MKKETKEKVYLVCNSSSEIAPRHVLRIYKSKAAAYNFLGRYVAELEKSTLIILGDKSDGKKSS